MPDWDCRGAPGGCLHGSDRSRGAAAYQTGCIWPLLPNRGRFCRFARTLLPSISIAIKGSSSYRQAFRLYFWRILMLVTHRLLHIKYALPAELDKLDLGRHCGRLWEWKSKPFHHPILSLNFLQMTCWCEPTRLSQSRIISCPPIQQSGDVCAEHSGAKRGHAPGAVRH